jgi:hypothetical protein
MPKELCQFCTLPATHQAVVKGQRYPRLCAKHWRILVYTPEVLPEKYVNHPADNFGSSSNA